MILLKYLAILGRYLIVMGRTFSVPEKMRMFFKSYVKEMAQLGVNSIGIVLLISFFIGAVICIQMKLNIQSPWMLKLDHVSNPCWKGRVEHRLGAGYNARHPAD